MQSYRHIEAPFRLFVGDGSLIKTLEKELARLDCQRAVILCGHSLAQSPSLDLVRRSAGNRFAGVCEGVRAHSPRQAVEEAADRIAELNADAVIAVGGGSAMVTARATVIALAEDKPLDELCTRRDAQGRMQSPRLAARKLPIIAVPTTPNTAVVKPGTAIFDEASGRRLALFDPNTRPQAIFLEPALLMTSPRDLMRNAVLNTLSSAVEGLVSGAADPISQGLLIHALRITTERLSDPAEYDAETRVKLAAAAIMCGRGTDNTGMGLATVISHAIAKAYDVDGGIAKVVALPHVLRFNWDYIQDGREMLTIPLGCEESDIVAALTRLLRDLGLPDRLRDLGVPFDGLPDIAANCMTDWFIRTNPRPIEREEDILSLLAEAW